MRNLVFGFPVRHKLGYTAKDGLRKKRDCTIYVEKIKALMTNKNAYDNFLSFGQSLGILNNKLSGHRPSDSPTC